MSTRTAMRQRLLADAVMRGRAMAEDAMTQTCTIEENQIGANGQDNWQFVAGDVKCRVTVPGHMQPLALGESASAVFQYTGNWHIHVPIAQAIAVGARVVCDGIHYLLIGEKTQKTYPVERVLLATSLHAPGTDLP